ncbi:glycosyltransferase family 2 protein [Burkholderia sp. AU16741]|uniref:glycosyltransferase family 2 protein n=1 Tax=Burkholderia sp. AU16741 TaxID=2015347 RepID=UPI00211B0E10|nr:glycosyltransferase family A protein [Burkholderia sp. AU16741]
MQRAPAEAAGCATPFVAPAFAGVPRARRPFVLSMPSRTTMEIFRMPNFTDTAARTRTAARSVATRAAFVLETNNLRGGAGLAQAVDSLKRVVAALAKQTVTPAEFAQWIITHDGLPADACADIAALAGRPIDFVEIGASTGYYDAKNDGFDRVDADRCDIVVFGDADCQPADDWAQAPIWCGTAGRECAVNRPEAGSGRSRPERGEHRRESCSNGAATDAKKPPRGRLFYTIEDSW